MLTNILSGLFILAVVLRALSGVLKARKTYWLEALIRTVFLFVSAALSIYVASMLSSIAAEPLANLLTDLVGPDFEGIIKDVPSALHITATLITVVITPLVFTIVFAILRLILCKILTRPICKLILKIAGGIKKEDLIEAKYSPYFNRKYRKFSLLALPFCVIFAVAAFIISTIPYVNTFYLVAATAQSIGTKDATVEEVTTAITDNVGTVTVMTLGGDKIYDALTHFTIDGHEVSLMEETKFVSDLSNGISSLTNSEASPDEMAESLRTAKDSIKQTSIVPMLASDIINAAGEDWLAGRDFHGIKCPSIGENFDDVVITFIECTQGSTCDTMREDIGTLIEIFAVIAENEVIASNNKELDISHIISDEELIAGISYALLESERLSPVVGSILDMSMQMVSSAFEIPENKEAALAVFADSQELVENGTIVTLKDVSVNRETSSDSETESLAVASVLKSLGDLLYIQTEDGSNEVSMVTLMSSFGPVFDSIRESSLMGDNSAKNLLTGIFQSEKVRTATGLDISEATDIATSIIKAVDNGSTYTIQLSSLANVLDMMSNTKQLTSSNFNPMTGEMEDVTEDTVITDELVDEILANITPDTVYALKPLVPENTEVSDAQKDNLLNIANDKWQTQKADANSNLSDDEFLDVISSVASMIDVQIAVGPDGNIIIVNP